MMESNQSAARDARRYLTERVRNDWAFPGIDDGAAADSPDAPATAFRYEPSEEELRGVSEFRERYYGSTDDDNDSSDDGDDGQEQGAGDDTEGKEYKFDSPDHVGRRLEERAERRKRRRRARLEEEMAWNEGVTCFVRRRDAWTGAASVRKFARRRSRASADMEQDEVEAQRAVEKVLKETAVVEEVVVKKEEEEEEEEEEEDGEQKGDSANEVEAEVDGGGEVGESAEGPKETERRINIDIPASEEPLVPLAPPMLPHNAIRQSITPKAYPDIYGKIVVAGQTPKVPINLAHMTRALVQGWKDDGEWPPRPGPVDPLMGRKKIAIGGGKVSTLAAVLGGGSDDNKGNASTGSAHHGEFLAHHPHLQRGVESVKKVFRLSGGHHGHPNPGGGLVHDGQPPAS
ncbi:hypothetical protein GTA08_BOTSDO00380 [Botryosphaeria dothidea]|uniref:Gag1-like clamp domain-containing protein n=1 Tax=Botryosphaeria dothidea TaxID=55169 RepID=A0A8H4N996_9PEZI|nr:hypothetical protein GTA08_BOTSDO00380 [Botryosphaeria dothidea]